MKLPKAKASYGFNTVQRPAYLPGLQINGTTSAEEPTYHETIQLCRYFYNRDPIAGTVINRMSNMAVTHLRNRWKEQKPAEKIYWDEVAKKIEEFFKSVAIEYFIHGLVVPDYTLESVMGKTIDPTFGRKRLVFPAELWARNVEHIVLKKRPTGMNRQAYMQIPTEDVDFIINGGKRSDGTDDVEGYRLLVEEFPDYVAAVKNGVRVFPLPDVKLLMRNVVSYDDYPAPYLRNALNALQHKEYLKLMDRTIASRAIESIRHIAIGNDTFPADQEDIDDAENKVSTAAGYGDRVFNLYTNHTWVIKWILPPLDVLTNDAKYSEPNADIFLAMGFPRVLTVGETAKSNSSDSKIALLGPVSTLNDLRELLLSWTTWFYRILGDANNMVPPKPYLSPIPIQDITSLIQFSSVARMEKAISRDVISQLYGTTFEAEVLKMKEEEDLLKEYGLVVEQIEQNPGEGNTNETTDNQQ